MACWQSSLEKFLGVFTYMLFMVPSGLQQLVWDLVGGAQTPELALELQLEWWWRRSPRRHWHSGSWGQSSPPGPSSAVAPAWAGLSQKMAINFHPGLGDSRQKFFEVLKNNFHFILVNYFSSCFWVRVN